MSCNPLAPYLYAIAHTCTSRTDTLHAPHTHACCTSPHPKTIACRIGSSATFLVLVDQMDKEPWPIPAPQPHAASRSTASRLSRGYGPCHGGPNDPNAQRTSSTTDPRRRSKRPRTERAHIIPAIPTPAERERQAALHTDPHQAGDGASSSYAASLPRLPAGLLPGGQPAADTRPRRPAADQRPEQRVGGRTPQGPPPQAGRNDTGPRHGHRPPHQMGPYATGLPTPAATQPNRRGAEDAP